MSYILKNAIDNSKISRIIAFCTFMFKVCFQLINSFSSSKNLCIKYSPLWIHFICLFFIEILSQGSLNNKDHIFHVYHMLILFTHIFSIFSLSFCFPVFFFPCHHFVFLSYMCLYVSICNTEFTNKRK